MRLPKSLFINLLIIWAISCIAAVCKVSAGSTFVAPNEVDLVSAAPDSVQMTMHNNKPVIIHRRTPEQMALISAANASKQSVNERIQHYTALAKTFGNEYASAIMQFTEAYYQSGNDFISELPEFGIYGMVSPVLGCAVSKTDTGFIDPCFNVLFDFTGRMIPNDRYVLSRLTVLPYKIDNKILRLLDDYKATEVTDFTPNIMALDISPFKKAIEAIQWERLDILKTIVEKHPKVIAQKGTNNATLILIAASRNASLEYLLSLSTQNINEITNDGYTPIMLAILADNIERAEILIRHGARIDSYSQSGYSAKSIEYWLENYYVTGEEEKTHIMMRLNKAVAKQHL